MLRYSSLLLLLVSSLLFYNAHAQCQLQLKGLVLDEGNGLPLDLVHLFIEETGQKTITNETGQFKFNNLCAGHFHLSVSHIGCETKYFHIDIEQDTMLYLSMAHTSIKLKSVVIENSEAKNSPQKIDQIYSNTILKKSGKTLTDILETVSGISKINNGNDIAKPILHGLYGNRLLIVNNGIPQSGQQWGVDHAPEIDPLSASTISVVKGASALQFTGGGYGNIILVSQQTIPIDPHLHGRVSHSFESNGMSNGLSAKIQKRNGAFGWRLQGTLKKSGDKKSPDYFLNNTGSELANLTLQLQNKHKNNWTSELHSSTFYNKLGVLRGAHIGNLTDLNNAINRPEPFYTEEKFSYAIDAPSQTVSHYLTKIRAKKFINENNWLELVTSLQVNNRKEFDVRRSGRTNIPALSILQFNSFNSATYFKRFSEFVTLKSGLQLNVTDNTNQPETGILPLIPDYLMYEPSAFSIISFTKNNSNLEGGIRYNFVFQDVAGIATDRAIFRDENVYHNFDASLGFNQTINNQQVFKIGLGFSKRSPAINEMYSSGLHQGVSGIEEGNSLLKEEKLFKVVGSYTTQLHKSLSVEALGYYQYFNDYIYLQPQNETRLTIRGAFPLYTYEQTDAAIFGFDAASNFELNKIAAKLKYSYLQGNDLSNNNPLVFMPPNKVTTSLAYNFSKDVKLGFTQLENLSLSVTNKYVFEQNHLNNDQDFLAAPIGYNLLEANINGAIQMKKSRLNLSLTAENILNQKYRSYLNRLRYFSDEVGFNLTFNTSLNF